MSARAGLDLGFATATQLAAALRAGELSAYELVQAQFARIHAHNPVINALVTLDEERALQRARAADAALARGEACGPLHGVPFTLKDAHATAGVRTTVGAPDFANYVPERDGTVAARLQSAGAILLGKTNVPPLLMRAQTDNPLFGRTSNPWNLERTAGGSSGGSAAAVAAGLAPFDIGSDMSGSIRIPAGYCGVFGLKPTANRIPLTGHIPPPPGEPRPERLLACVGPLARSVEDLALLASVLVGPDGSDCDVPPLPWQQVPSIRLDRITVAYQRDFAGVPTSQASREAVGRVLRELEAAGARIVERPPGFSVDELNAVWRDFATLLGATLQELYGMQLPARMEATLPPTLGNACRVLARRETLVNALDRLFDSADVFLSPTCISTAPVHAPPGTPFVVDGVPVETRFVDHYLYPFSFTGNPALVVPAGLAADGLPISVQLVGRRWQDERLLGVARAVSDCVDGYRSPPPFCPNTPSSVMRPLA